VNDLAERALLELDAARRKIAARPLTSLGAAGFVVSAGIVVIGGRVPIADSITPLTSWLGLQHEQANARALAAAAYGGICLLLVLWLIALRVLHRTPRRERCVWWLAGIWALPFVVGPPLLSTDVYGYVADGSLVRAGANPYDQAATALGQAPIVGALDINSRGAVSTSGPLTTWAEHAIITVCAGHALAAVIVLRVIAVAAAIGIGLLARQLAGARSVAALGLTVLNPAVLLLVVSACHLEGVLAVLLLGAIVSARRGRWPAAVAFAAVAGLLAPVALIAVPAVIIAHTATHRVRPVRAIARDVAVAAVLLVAGFFSVRDGLGWLRNVNTLTRGEYTPFAPASLVADLLDPIVRPASSDDLATGARIAAGAAAGCIALYLLITARMRPLDHTIGYALLTFGLLAPVLHPWYLLWGTLALAPMATRIRRDVVVALSCAACVLVPVGLAGAAALNLSRATLGVIALILLARLIGRQRAARALVIG